MGLRNSKIKTLDIKRNITGENTPGVFDYYNKDYGNLFFSSDILGPSFSIKTKIKDKEFQLGLFSRVRTQVSAVKIDNYLKFENQGFDDPDSYVLKPFNVTMMNWGEIGFNVATEILPYASQRWIIGANLRYEMGYDAVQLISLDPFQLRGTYEEINGVQKETLTASNYNIKANYATNYNFDSNKYDFKKNGQGFGLDLGISMIDKDENADNYNFKASFSLIDLGSVNFKGQKHLFKGGDLKIVNNPIINNAKFENPEQYLKILSQEVYGDENQSLQGTDFSMGLPTNIHFNFSQNIAENQYLNLDWIQRAPVFKNSLKRNNVVNLSYSVQMTFLGYGGSVSLQEYQKLQLGGYFRVGPLILGSSNVFPLFFKQKKLNSGDFYIAIKIYPFWDNEFKRHRRADCNCEN